MDKLLLPTSIVGAGVCLLFSMSAVVVLGCYKERTRPLMIKQQFSVSLVFTYIVILSSLEGFRSKAGCRIVSVLAHYGIIASFLWILCDIYHVSICIKKKNFPPSFLKIVALIWGLPLIFVISSIIIGLTVNQTFKQRSKFYKCWKTDHLIWTLAIPCIFVIIASAYVLFTSTHMVFQKKKNSLTPKAKSSIQAIKYSIKTNMVMLLLTTIVWIFGCQIFWYNAEVKYHLVFGLAAGIQGLFLFFFYCVFCLEHDLYVNEKSFSEFSVNFEEPAIKRRESEFRRMSVSTQMKDKNGSNHMNDIIEEKEDGTLRPTVDEDATQHIEPNSKLLSATSNRNSSISGSTKALIHSPEVKAPHVMQVSESPDSLTNDKPNEETAAVGKDNTTVEKSDTTNLSSADQQHSMNRKSEYKDDSQPLPDHETSKQSSDALQNTRDKPSSQTSNLSKNVSYAGSEFSLGNTKSPPMARNLSVASILSRTSQTSYASNMGLNELESLFNNPDLFKQKTIPRGMRPSTHSLTQSPIANQPTSKTTNQNKTQTAIDEDLQGKSLEIAEKAPPTVDTEQKCVDNTSDIITNINADTEKV